MDLHGKVKQRHPWGVVGITVEEGESLIQRRESDVKTVPCPLLNHSADGPSQKFKIHPTYQRT